MPLTLPVNSFKNLKPLSVRNPDPRSRLPVNRIKISPLAASHLTPPVRPASEPALDQIERLTVNAETGCSVFVPMHYEPGYRYPLLIWLHTPGDDRSELHRVLPRTSLRNYVGVSVDGPSGDSHAGFCWGQDAHQVAHARAAVDQAIDHAMMRFNVHPQRIFLAGSGTGGEMAFRIGLGRPDLFAGVISLNGPVPTVGAPLCDWSRCRDLPIFWSQCRESVEFSEPQLCEQLKLLHIAGFSVTLRQYPGTDQITDTMLSDLNNWIMETIESAVGTRSASEPGL